MFVLSFQAIVVIIVPNKKIQKQKQKHKPQLEGTMDE